MLPEKPHWTYTPAASTGVVPATTEHTSPLSTHTTAAGGASTAVSTIEVTEGGSSQSEGVSTSATSAVGSAAAQGGAWGGLTVAALAVVAIAVVLIAAVFRIRTR